MVEPNSNENNQYFYYEYNIYYYYCSIYNYLYEIYGDVITSLGKTINYPQMGIK